MIMKNGYRTGMGYLDLELSDIIGVYRTKKYPPNPYRSGYGRKIPTQYMIKTVDGRLHRVYCVCYSNSGSLWIQYKKELPMCETAMLDYALEKKISINDVPYLA